MTMVTWWASTVMKTGEQRFTDIFGGMVRESRVSPLIWLFRSRSFRTPMIPPNIALLLASTIRDLLLVSFRLAESLSSSKIMGTWPRWMIHQLLFGSTWGKVWINYQMSPERLFARSIHTVTLWVPSRELIQRL